MATMAEEGWVDDGLGREFPGLGLLYQPVRRAGHTSEPAIRARLAGLEAYFDGAFANTVAARPLTAAYRVFHRQIGLDPNVDRTFLEHVVRERLAQGRFVPRGLLHDTLTIAAVETEVPLIALRAPDVQGPLGLTTSRDGEALGGQELPESTLVIADAVRPLAVVGAESPEASSHVADERDPDVVLCAIVAPGVPPVTAHESLWLAAELLGEAG